MPYSDKDRQRQYQREWYAKRRAEFFADKACVVCNATEELELDHIDSFSKTCHKIWSWAKSRREAEIAKCQVLCHRCHVIKTQLAGEFVPKFRRNKVRA